VTEGTLEHVGTLWSTVGVNTRIHDGKVDWADRVVDHRDLLLKPWFPSNLPTPGAPSLMPQWRKGVRTIDLPDTRHLPSGDIGGPFTVSAHIVMRGPAPADRALVCVMTYPDGYRLASMWPGEIGEPIETWRAWMSSDDGMTHAFSNAATGWTLAQRAYAARRWYTFEAAMPAGVSFALSASGKDKALRATKGVLCTHGDRLVRSIKKVEIAALQRAGFWLPDPAQARWLASKAAPLAKGIDDGSDDPDGTRLRAMYESGWKIEVYEAWLRSQPTNAPNLHARNFMRRAAEWEDTIEQAYATMGERAAAAGDETPAMPRNSDGVAQIGEVASLCIQLGLNPFNIGVMVGAGTFNIDALRTLSALRADPLRSSSVS
jgi:hypothetical protein